MMLLMNVATGFPVGLTASIEGRTDVSVWDFGADGDRFAAMHGNDDLPAAGMAPLLMATAPSHARKAMLPEDPDDIIGVTHWEAMAQGRATSRSLPFFGMSTGVGSNHNARASLALATASSSVSPAHFQILTPRRAAITPPRLMHLRQPGLDA